MKIPDIDPKNPPGPDYPGMIICPGRYYYGLVTVAIAPAMGAHGADMTGMLWRYEDKPREWHFTCRLRFYAGQNNDPWDEQDKKKWMYRKMTDLTEDEAKKNVDESLLRNGLLLGAVGIRYRAPDWFIIQGDCDKAGDLMQKNPPHWMSSKRYDMKDGKPTAVKTKGWHPPAQ